MYHEEDFLAISGLQHFAFCRRQWALIHIEQQWQENLRTVEGHILHENAHDAFFTQKRGTVLISRGMAVQSRTLGVNGVCDVVELHASPDGVPIFGRGGNWLPIPVEYKRGSPKETDADRLQLCCQVCAWRRCSAAIFQRPISITVSPTAAARCCWRRSFARKSVLCCGKCMTITAGNTHRA